MTADPANGTTSPFEAGRLVSSIPNPAREPQDWSDEMTAVSQHRCRDSFMRIYDHFMPRLCLYLRGLGTNAGNAEELAQETLLKLWLRADLYDATRSSLSTWLFRIARNLYIDRVRKEPGWAHVQESVTLAEADDPPTTTAAETHAEHVRLKRRIDALPTIQARLIRMSYFEAKSHQEIAQELAMPLGTVKSHLRRAFLRLQRDIGGQP